MTWQMASNSPYN